MSVKQVLELRDDEKETECKVFLVDFVNKTYKIQEDKNIEESSDEYEDFFSRI